MEGYFCVNIDKKNKRYIIQNEHPLGVVERGVIICAMDTDFQEEVLAF